MNRGSAADFRPERTSDLSFNEAPIHESGKFDSGPLPAPTCNSGFNEAPIHESGKSEGITMTTHDAYRASMRPRFMNWGSMVFVSMPPAQALASMRPRFMNRGSDPGWAPAKCRLLASMRPRFMNRGSMDVFQEMAVEFYASMRPRFMNRGSARMRRHRRAGTRLQ